MSKRNVFSSALVPAISSMVLVAFSSPCLASDLLVEVTPTRNAIIAGDILFLDVSVLNLGEVPVKLHDRTGSPFGTLSFEVRRPGEKEFRDVPTAVDDEPSMVSVAFPIEPMQRFNSSEVLFHQSPSTLLFDRTGSYSIRVRIGPGERAIAQSKVVKVLVQPPDSGMIDHCRAAIRLIDYGLGLRGIRHDLNANSCATVSRELQDSELRNTLAWMAQIARIRDATDDGQRKAAREELEKIRKKAHPYQQEWISLTAAAEYIKLKQFDLAKAELAKIKDGNTEKAAAQQRIISIIRDRADVRGTSKS